MASKVIAGVGFVGMGMGIGLGLRRRSKHTEKDAMMNEKVVTPFLRSHEREFKGSGIVKSVHLSHVFQSQCETIAGTHANGKLFGVIAGHGGPHLARLIKREFPPLLLHSLSTMKAMKVMGDPRDVVFQSVLGSVDRAVLLGALSDTVGVPLDKDPPSCERVFGNLARPDDIAPTPSSATVGLEGCSIITVAIDSTEPPDSVRKQLVSIDEALDVTNEALSRGNLKKNESVLPWGPSWVAVSYLGNCTAVAGVKDKEDWKAMVLTPGQTKKLDSEYTRISALYDRSEDERSHFKKKYASHPAWSLGNWADKDRGAWLFGLGGVKPQEKESNAYISHFRVNDKVGFIIVGNDQLWGGLDPESAVKLIGHYLDKKGKEPPNVMENVSERFVYVEGDNAASHLMRNSLGGQKAWIPLAVQEEMPSDDRVAMVIMFTGESSGEDLDEMVVKKEPTFVKKMEKLFESVQS